MMLDPATVKTERIKEDADYEDLRVRIVGLLGKARVTMQSPTVKRWLVRHPRLLLHFVPTYSSWLKLAGSDRSKTVADDRHSFFVALAAASCRSLA